MLPSDILRKPVLKDIDSGESQSEVDTRMGTSNQEAERGESEKANSQFDHSDTDVETNESDHGPKVEMVNNQGTIEKFSIQELVAAIAASLQSKTLNNTPDVGKYADRWITTNTKDLKDLPQLNLDIKLWRRTFDRLFKKYPIIEKLIRSEALISEIKLSTDDIETFGLDDDFKDKDFQSFLRKILTGINSTLIDVSGDQYSFIPKETSKNVIEEIYRDSHSYYLDQVSSYVKDLWSFNSERITSSTQIGTKVDKFFETRDYKFGARYFFPLSLHDGAYHHFLHLVTDEYRKYLNGEDHRSLQQVFELYEMSEEHKEWERKFGHLIKAGQFMGQKFNERPFVDKPKNSYTPRNPNSNQNFANKNQNQNSSNQNQNSSNQASTTVDGLQDNDQ